MANPDKIVNYNFFASYTDNNYIENNLYNQIQHNKTIENVKDYINSNIQLSGSETYEAEKQNFLFVAGDIDFVVTVNGSVYTVSEFVLCTEEKPFDFQIQLTSSTMPCSVNLHIFHGSTYPKVS